ncbi:hypothetical protein [Rhizobium sp. BE258]|uniref:hypothetical protein n=1 Tax=Rhizobium sp. BE258 TaxID=2817722 RepID=UPI0028559B2B|nr:hypothetical protein [Rhizobium sp. BE258]MDR7147044.1 hypothetical protein [Rhizobium sp. BE258]
MSEVVSSTTEVWPVLIPALVGGVLTLAGSVIVPAVAHYFSVKSAHQAERRRRFEEMLAAAYEHEHWLELQKLAKVFGEGTVTGPAPINKAMAIALLHFRELVGPLRALDLASTQYQAWMSEAGFRRLNLQLDKVNDGFQVAYRKWGESFSDFQDAVTKFSEDRNGKV